MNIRKYKIAIPSMLTSISILAGIMAIFICIDGTRENYSLACWLIIMAAVIDGLDGKVARLTRTSSEFGIQFDSIADVITFGAAATAVLFRSIFLDRVGSNPIFYVFPVIFLICGAVRLARFNITATTGKKTGFTGLPIPTAAGALMSLLLIFTWMDNAGNGAWLAAWLAHKGIAVPDDLKLRITIGYLVVVSFLMVSLVKYPTSFGFFFNDIRGHKIRSFINALLVVILFIYPSVTFFLVSVFYIAYGFATSTQDPVQDNGETEKLTIDVQ
ncbi:MAG: CDP-diacylglycerol--serine O-phosphatidyltransferase [Candidatus Raymondbacteria bacterium RifOxyC12_full_50_8]|uniref:CDP-diacylglycerol--serine O-phosphatidyltransferase n=1 Tax=Candidatus Raymondbacteria bacterium RIFOXYD12_FULL_49_13 TaxID=1817890 RepID=A0A1F7FI63_UNCRA|nr:MAG: CDP-diacylglycerol--serine O-phosphatidyltransferase [Candidatus Raymondbacteria bacterium RIFOXYA2_FULL_49_16]OGJ95682.1 MAG: CDP-diacylglycerol--serine O-phosphatidyltransferase [Candidatus Raymondbacteria bacterium RifOxyB12_full_50_8]OGK05955.1 MAG: CDP-diacylglycerol--serine O-phosphatidyltransferase [Candidatus Raymondbacteria bacterium RifOxyC12_full_50_8]OGK06313.1 MAG: CDP-diacylglycerol--serine O-phosphatidyltransferase [Candidatus Raymondbacteria bacterium RIFOXYD12_FULL_49_13